MSSIKENFQKVLQRIDRARNPNRPVRLLAVSKTQPAEAIHEAWQVGQRDFGENYLQEARGKMEELASLEGLVWHFIGPIQSNKTREIATHFDWVHSIDRLRIARRLNEQRPEKLPPLNVCIQVNVSEEPSKSGVLLAELPELVKAVNDLPALRLRGLMAIPEPAVGFETQRMAFRIVAGTKEKLNGYLRLKMDTLSMGMSSDLEAAIAEGANLVRIGTALFGARPARLQ